MTYRVAFNRPPVAVGTLDRLAEVLACDHASGDGPMGKRASAIISSLHNNAKVLLTTSCTHALEMTALLADVGLGDEVIIPSYTFVSTANAYALRGATIVFADIRPDTLNLDEKHVADLVTSRTKAIVAVNYAGVGCDLPALSQIAQSADAMLIEDNAHGFMGSYQGQPLGTFGALSTLSFHETKNLSSGEGGALIINDPTLYERAEIIREKGTNRSRFFRGQVDKYSWVDIGSSYLPSEFVSAVLVAQLEDRERIQLRRSEIWSRYRGELVDWADANDVTLPIVPANAIHPSHMFYLLLPSLAQRTRFIDHLKNMGVMSVFHYLPLHTSKYGTRYNTPLSQCRVTTDISDRITRLPLFESMTGADQDVVISAITTFRS